MGATTIVETDAALSSPAKDTVSRFKIGTGVVSALRLLLTFLLLFVFSWLGVDLARHSNGVATLWFSNGILFSIVIRRPRSSWLPYAAVGLAADIAADVVFGDSFPVALGVSCANSLEVFLTAFLLTRWFGIPVRLSRPTPLFAFLGTAVLTAPALTGVLSSSWLTLFNTFPWWETCRTWYLGDALGMAIIAPLFFALQEPGFFDIFQNRALPQTLLVLTAPAAAALLDFTQSSEPFPVLIMPALIFATYRRGFSGAVIGVFLTACISISVTIGGHGLMTLAPVSSPLHNIVSVQIFIAFTLFTILPVSALLEESRNLALSLRQSETRYMELANTDALTGQANRRAFDQRLEDEWRRPNPQPLAILSLDVDLFKAYNDIYGHIAGDDCLRRIAGIAAETLHERSSARLYRLGGEEFAIILPNANADEALGLAERIRRAVFAARIEHSGSPLQCQTISIGIAAAIPDPGLSALSLLGLSDQALYTAKHSGRNRCEAA